MLALRLNQEEVDRIKSISDIGRWKDWKTVLISAKERYVFGRCILGKLGSKDVIKEISAFATSELYKDEIPTAEIESLFQEEPVPVKEDSLKSIISKDYKQLSEQNPDIYSSDIPF